MTNNYKFARFATLLLVFFAFLTQTAKAQLFTDQFNYTTSGTLAGDSLIRISGPTLPAGLNGIWKGHSGYVAGVPTNPQLQTATSLTYATYPTVGGATTLATTGLDINATFASQTSGSVYASAIVSLSAAQATGDYFMHLSGTSLTQTWNVNTTALTGRVFAKSSGTGFQLAFTRATAAVTYGATVYPFNTPIFIVFKHNIVAGTTNDTVAMYVFTTGLPPTIEPTVPDFTDAGTTADPTEISKISIRQGTAANAPTGLIDYIRVGTTWVDVTSAPATSTPSIAITQGATAIPTANTPAFNMGSVVAGSNLDVTFTVTNAGTAPLTLTTPITVVGAGYSIQTQPTSPVANGAGNTTTFVVRFNSATAVANAVGTVTITNNANTTYVVNLLATATAPAAPIIVVTRGAAIPVPNLSSVNLGSTPINTNLDITFTITNTGNAPLVMNVPLAIVSVGNVYSIITQPAASIPSGVGNTSTITIRLNSPTVNSLTLASLSLSNNSGGSTGGFFIDLSADVTAVASPNISVTQGVTPVPSNNIFNPFVMGTTPVNTNLDATFTITNTGAAALGITVPLTVSGAGYSVFTQPAISVSNVSPTNTTTFVVRFNSATAVANAAGIVTIINTTGTNYVINLLANATAVVTTPSIAITQGATSIPTANAPAFSMGSVALSTNLDVTFTITNGGTAPLTLTTPITIVGAGFTINSQPTSPVANSGTTTFVVRFNSAVAVANAVGTITITNNANTTYVVNLTASATAPVVGGVDYEPFNQASGSVATTNGWLTHSGTAAQITISSSSLVYSTLATPTGNKIAIVSTNSEDINRATTAPLTSDSYYSAIINVQNTTNMMANTGNGEYFMALGVTTGTTAISGLNGRLYVRQGVTANTFNIGILNTSGGTPTFSTVDYTLGTSYFIAVKYAITTNSATLWINPATGLTTEPTTAIAPNASGIVAAPASLLSIVIRQGGTLAPTPPALPGTTGNIEIDEIRVGTTWASVTPAGPVVLTPTLTATPTTLTAFASTTVGANSASQSYTLVGTNLSGNVTVTAPTDFQIATTATGTYSATLTYTSAQLATAQTVFVRFSPLTSGNKAGSITHTATGASASVGVSGTSPTTLVPTIVAVLSVADFGTVNTGAVSTVKSFAVQGTNLTDVLVVTAPTNFQVSRDGVAFSTAITFTAAEVVPINGKDVFVRFAPTSGVSGLKDVVITSTSVGAVSKTTSVRGTESSPTTALDNSFAKEVVIYPNPTQNSFQVKLPTNSKIYAVEIVDISGKVILTKKSDEIISVENLQKGFYFVKFSNAERTFTKKLSIN